MPHINLNLLPAEKKETLRLEQIFRHTLGSAIFITIWILIGGGGLMLARFIVQNHNATLTNNAVIKNKQVSTDITPEAIETLNQQIKFILEKFPQNHETTDISLDFTKRVPEGVRITNIQMKKTTNEVTISGTAKTRDDLLTFQKSLEESAFFQNITFPISSLSSPQNIPFQLKSEFEQSLSQK